MEKILNSNLIDAMTEALPHKTNLASYLIDTLSISKEAVYRRLRNEVSFTFDEAVKVVSTLNISLDKIIGNNKNSGAIINVSLIKSSDDIANYNDTLLKYLNICDALKQDPEATLHEATNKLPIHFYAPYTHLIKFWVSRWLHQSNNLKGTGSLDDFNIPEKTILLHKHLSKELRAIPSTIFIWDKRLFQYFVKGVLYFSKLNLLSEEDVINIKRELHELLDELEILLATSTYKEGGKIYIYLSNIPLEGIYSYLESTDIQMSMLRVYAINLIDSQHPDVFRIQKKWVQSLRRYSTLITDSSEMERIEFLDRQRECVNTLKI